VPIRTRRGRSGAYRALWAWPLHSPARLAAVVAVLVALAIGLSALAGGGSAPSSSVPAASRAAAPATVPSARPSAGVDELRPQRLPLADAPPAAVVAAIAWTTAWATHPPGVSGAAWSAGLRPWTTEEYLPTLSSVDPANVPGTRVTGPAVAVDVRPDAVRVQVPTDAVRLELLLVQVGPGQWRVSGYDRAS